jgi:hypothetical protein
MRARLRVEAGKCRQPQFSKIHAAPMPLMQRVRMIRTGYKMRELLHPGFGHSKAPELTIIVNVVMMQTCILMGL